MIVGEGIPGNTWCPLFFKKHHSVVNLSTPRPDPSTALRTSGLGLLEVHPEPRLSTPPSKTGLRAAERVNHKFLSMWMNALKHGFRSRNLQVAFSRDI